MITKEKKLNIYLFVKLIVFLLIGLSIIVFRPQLLSWLKYCAGGFLLYLFAVLLERYGLMDQIFKTKIWDFTYRNNMELYLFNLPVPHLYFRLFYEILGLPVWPSILLITICFFPTLYLIVWLVSKPAALVRNLSDKLQGKKA